jgi:hypothetical protein
VCTKNYNCENPLIEPLQVSANTVQNISISVASMHVIWKQTYEVITANFEVLNVHPSATLYKNEYS